MSRAPIWKLDGPDTKPERPALADALRRLYEGRPGPPTEADVPPPSTFPMTPAARAALRLSRKKP